MVDDQIHWSTILVYPALMATAYVIVSPATSFASNSIWAFARKWINIILRHFDKDSYLPIDKSLKLRQDIYNADKKYIAMFEDSNEERARHVKEIESMRNQNRLNEDRLMVLETELQTKDNLLEQSNADLSGKYQVIEELSNGLRDANFRIEELTISENAKYQEIEDLNARTRNWEDSYNQLETVRSAQDSLINTTKTELQERLNQKSREVEDLTLKLKRNLDVNDEEKKILGYLATHSSVEIERFTEILPKMPLEKRQYHLDKLRELGYVILAGNNYILTVLGRAFYFEKVELVSNPQAPNLPPYLLQASAPVKEAPRIS